MGGLAARRDQRLDKVSLNTKGKSAPLRRRALCLVIAFLLLASAGIVILAEKPIKYAEAFAALGRGEYEEAAALFESIDYKSSAVMVKECSYRRAEELLDSGIYEQARDIFSDLGEYSNSRDMARECTYAMAEQLFSDGQYLAACDMFDSLQSYRDSAERAQQCRELIYQAAVASMRRCEFQEAEDGFSLISGYADSGELLEYCQRRQSAEAQRQGAVKYIREINHYSDFPGGALYGVEQGLVFVPNECNEDTKCIIYYAGGTGEKLLYLEGVWYYLSTFSPNAVIMFFYTSGYNNIETRNEYAAELMEDIAIDCGITLHDMAVIGSSHGSYTALHAPAQLYKYGGIKVKNVLLLDAGLEWDVANVLSEEERAVTAELGTSLYLFEQDNVGLNKEPIRDMVAAGDKVVIVVCAEADHNRISVNAYKYGLFSWSIGEYSTLNSMQYKPVPLTEADLEEYYLSCENAA